MLTDPIFRENIATLVMLIFAAIAIGGVVHLFTRKAREREKLRKFNETRVRL